MKSTNLKFIQHIAQYVHESITLMARTEENIPLSVKLFDEVAYRLWMDMDTEIEAAKKEEEMQSEF